MRIDDAILSTLDVISALSANLASIFLSKFDKESTLTGKISSGETLLIFFLYCESLAIISLTPITTSKCKNTLVNITTSHVKSQQVFLNFSKLFSYPLK